ncbi:unnamed protein product [Caenorhabditis brenneri]
MQCSTNYLSTPGFLSTVLHIQSILDVPVLSYGVFCIVWKTPKAMRSVKFYMLNLHFWGALFAVNTSFLAIPYLLLPTLSGYFLGAVDAPGELIYGFLTTLSATVSSILAIYENRYFVLFAQNSFWSRARKPFLILCFLVQPFIFLPVYLNIPEQEPARELVFKEFPCFRNADFGRKLFVLAVDDSLLFTTVFYLALTYCVLNFGFFGLTVYNLWLKKQKMVSKATMRVHRTFLKALIVQTLFLCTVILTPIIFSLLIIYTRYHNQTLINVLIILFSLHGVGSTIVMVLVHKPYREFTFCSRQF